ncbi:hypothetical protein RD792_014158 [Penstemon davidsonii]|uniref:Glycosyltransferase n=1 Tax=Penstemon davidsonii TaxID=160366 RepID=A0ABR0CP98_9LAMI|nr:hypothetical protein RD792_014158 [Penstemon davidsonii]
MLSKSQHTNTNNVIDFFSEARNSGLDIRYTTINDGFPPEFDRLNNFDEFWTSLLQDFPARVDGFIGKILQSEQSMVSFLIVDTFFSWPPIIAKKYNIVNVSFFTQPALVYSIGYHLDILRENGHYPLKENIVEEINYIPGVKSISTNELMHYLKEGEIETLKHKVSTRAFQEGKKADFVLDNTVQELESETLDELNKKQPIYAIGPISSFLTKINVTKNLWSESECTKWLESKPLNSVLYVSFGSFAQTNKHVIQEIAHGLVLSEVNFIWVVRENIVKSDGINILPDGFKDEVGDKGLIIPWCNQTLVLSNPAVGGFLTHCGWNSTIESIWCSAPMICYPIEFDQPTNKKLVVDDWKIGINLYDGDLIHRDEVAEKIRNLMTGTGSLGLKQEIEKLKNVFQKAIEKDGSSERNFDRFVEDLKAKIYA